jgi:hypothetical protein
VIGFIKRREGVEISKVKTISTILIFIVIGIIVAYIFLQQKEYTTLSDLEELFQKHKVSYEVSPVRQEYKLGTAKEQKIFLLEGNDVYVYIVDEPYFEQAVFDVTNELFNDSVVATVNNFIFAYSEENMELFYAELYAIIDEIRWSRK